MNKKPYNLDEILKTFSLTGSVCKRIDHSDTIMAHVYIVTHPLKGFKIVKVCQRRKDFYREMYFLKILADRLPVPKVFDAIEPSEDSQGVILMEYIEGNLLVEKDWSEELAYEMGLVLAKIHSIKMDYYGDIATQKDLTGSSLKYFQDKFFEELDECKSHLPGGLIDHCKQYFENHKSLLRSVDGPCLTHRDFRPGNLLVKEGRLAGVIDWANGRAGFAEQDFCSMEHRHWPKNDDEKAAFLEGYKSVRPLPDYKAIMPMIRLGRALAVIGFTVKSNTWKDQNKSLYEYNRHFLDQIPFS